MQRKPLPWPILILGLCAPYGSPAEAPPQAQATTNSLGMRMVHVAPGHSTMGSTEGDWDEQPVHRVTLSQPFWISATEVTLTQYQQFRPGHYHAAPSGAATGVSWHDAVAFCQWLSQREAKPYRLPTEAEWEYACRLSGTVETESKAGLLQMRDHVAEWCLDWYGEYQGENQVDPVGPDGGLARVVRGDKQDDSKSLLPGKTEPSYRRAANRAGMLPGFGTSQGAGDKGSAPGHHSIGFRVVQAPMLVTKPYAAALPLVRCGVKQSTAATASRHGPDPSRPYFRKRYLLPTPPENSDRKTIDAAGLHPSFCGHNHSPALEVLPNGDVLLVIFTSWTEYEPDMSLMAARLRFGADEWEMPSSLIDCPDACDNCPLLWTLDGQVMLFWAHTRAVGAFPFQWIVSADNGATWSEARFPRFTTPIGPHSRQPINTALKDRNGTVYVASDGAGANSVLWVSEDSMQSWQDPGGRTGGRHTTFVLLNDGTTILGLGGKNSDIGGYMPQSISADGGRSWTISPTIFPAYGANQRPCVLRLRSGRLFFCGDFQRIDGASPATVKDRGAFVALSADDGRTWRSKKLWGTQPHENPSAHGGADTIGYSVARQAPNGVIHLITTMNRPCLHFELNESWILSDEPAPASSVQLLANTATTIQDVRRYEEKHSNGQPRVIWHAGVANDGRYLLHGEERWYHPNGTTQYEASYNLGRRAGAEIFYRPDGRKAWEWGHVRDGVSRWTQWHSDGEKKAESTWQNFHAHGPARTWDRTGRLLSSAIFKQGALQK